MIEISNCFMNVNLAAGQKASLSRFIQYNLQIPKISSYNLDQVALLTEDDTKFSQEDSLIVGTKTEDKIFEAMKEGEIEKVNKIWMRVKTNQLLAKLHGEVGIQEALI